MISLLNKFKDRFSIVIFILLTLVIILINSKSSSSNKPENQEKVELANAEEQKTLARGKEIYFDPNLGSNGLSCESCHPKGEMTNAHSYPRYKHVLGTMATISMTHNFAVVNESKGSPWELGSKDANALVLYVKSLSNGKKIRMAWPKKFKNEWVDRGKLIFMDSGLGSNNKSCQSCHVKGGKKSTVIENIQAPGLKGVAATYPCYSFQHNRVITLEQRINYCFQNYLNSKSLPLNDETIVALCCYLTSLSEGDKISVARID